MRTASMGLALASEAIGLATASAWALPNREVERIYYSGPDMKTEVGTYYLSCRGRPQRSGRVTRWRYESTASCNTGGIAASAQCMVCDAGFVNCNRMSCPLDFAIESGR